MQLSLVASSRTFSSPPNRISMFLKITGGFVKTQLPWPHPRASDSGLGWAWVIAFLVSSWVRELLLPVQRLHFEEPWIRSFHSISHIRLCCYLFKIQHLKLRAIFQAGSVGAQRGVMADNHDRGWLIQPCVNSACGPTWEVFCTPHPLWSKMWLHFPSCRYHRVGGEKARESLEYSLKNKRTA